MDYFLEIQERVSMRDVLEYYSIYPVRGKNIYRCIEHRPDKNPSAGIIPHCNKFHCYRCNKTWSVVDVVMSLENCPTMDAVRLLDKIFKLGLFEPLSPKKQAEMDAKEAKHKHEREMRAKRKEFVREKLDEIAKKIKHWEQVQADCHPTRGQIRRANWNTDHEFFHALKEQARLTWLYDKVAGFDAPTCEFDFTIGDDRIVVLKKLRKGEIEI